MLRWHRRKVGAGVKVSRQVFADLPRRVLAVKDRRRLVALPGAVRCTDTHTGRVPKQAGNEFCGCIGFCLSQCVEDAVTLMGPVLGIQVYS